MKTITKSILAAAALVAASANANAGVYPAYTQNYDAVTGVAETGFTTGRGTLSLVENGSGKALSYALGQNNGSSAYVYWGTEEWANAEAKNNGVDNYYFSTDFSYTPGNNQAGGVFAVLSQTPQAEGATLPHGITVNWFTAADTLFYMSSTAANSAEFLALSPKTAEDTAAYSVSLTATTWYNLSLMINKETRAVKATIKLLSDGSLVKEINYTIPEKSLDITSISASGVVTRAETEHEINMLPTGLFLVANRYQSTWLLDNTVAGKYVEGVVAQAPTATLIGANNSLREFLFGYGKDETLNYKVTGNLTMLDINEAPQSESGTFDYSVVEAGENKFTFIAASNDAAATGTVEIWTTAGTTESDHITVDVEVSEIVLPEPDAKITKVSEGFAKTYLVTIDNSEVPTQPNLMFNYKFVAVDGTVIEKTDIASGTSIELDNAGTLILQTVKYAYTASKKVIKPNDQKYTKTQTIDFEHMTAAELEEKGFAALDPIQTTNMSGANNWSARLRLYDDIVVGTDTTRYYGPDYQLKRKIENGELEAFEATDDVYPKVERYQWQDAEANAMLASKIDSTQAMLFAPLYFPNTQTGYTKDNTFQVKIGIGLVNDELVQNNVPYSFRGMEEGQFAIIYDINGYGSNAAHGYFASVEEAKASNHGELRAVLAANSDFTLYRVDTALSLVEIMSADGDPVALPDPESTTPVKKIYANAVNDGAIYDLLGRKVDANNMKPGIYIQNGKKFIVK